PRVPIVRGGAFESGFGPFIRAYRPAWPGAARAASRAGAGRVGTGTDGIAEPGTDRGSAIYGVSLRRERSPDHPAIRMTQECPYCATWHLGPKQLVYTLGLTPEVPLMMRTKFLEEKFRQGRLDAKSLDNLFRRRIEQGANCSPFVSQAILQTVKQTYPLDPDDIDRHLGLGQIQLLAVAAEHPAGKPLDQCQKVTVCLTLDAAREDYQIRLAHGVEGLRRSRILRLTAEARDQGGLLS